MGANALAQLAGHGRSLAGAPAAARAGGDEARYSQLLDWGLRLVVVLAVPCAAALLVFGTPLIATLFHHGRFDAGDVQRVALALSGYGVGLLGQRWPKPYLLAIIYGTRSVAITLFLLAPPIGLALALFLPSAAWAMFSTRRAISWAT